jgi:tRNA modification GTPase
MSSTDSIFALATPAGKSGVAIVRLSGPQALGALQTLSGIDAIAPRRAYYVTLRHNQYVIDRGIALYFKGPRSFTGEDVVELQIHGGLAVIRQLLEVLSSMKNLRPAEPGEFSRRAFANGKMDLMEAEGLADLIDAETLHQKTQAERQMEGELSHYYDELRRQITHVLAHLEAYIDFPDEEIPDSVIAGLGKDIASIQSTIAAALKDQKRGERLREGITIVILGAPNAGKSSLLNTIAKKDAAIVSARAGTTRDAIEIHLDICGYPAILVDTAGLRETVDEIEGEGVRRALARAADADIKLVLFDGEKWPSLDKASPKLLDDSAIAVVNKSDLLGKREAAPIEAHFISTKTGEGVEALLSMLEQKIIRFFSGASAPFITRNRHRALLSEASAWLEKSLVPAPLELTCEDLRQAALAVGKITGKIQVDDVLDIIFKQFCIGK